MLPFFVSLVFENTRMDSDNLDLNSIAVDLFDRLANHYQERFMDVSLYSDSFNLFCERVLPQQATVLELACGPGNITKYILEKRPDFQVLATDLAPKMLELAKKNNPTASVQLVDCRKINQLGRTFDAIICGFCFPYLSKEEAIQFIRDASGILNSAGVLYISTMEDDYSKSTWKQSSTGDGQLFMHFHQADYLLKTLEDNGFKSIEVNRETYPAHDGTLTTDLLILAVKGRFG